MTQTLRAALKLAVVALLPGSIAWAQPPDPADMESSRQNAAMMRQYSWKMRGEMTADGKTKPAQIYQMRYDLGGKLQKTPLSGRSRGTSAGGRRR